MGDTPIGVQFSVHRKGSRVEESCWLAIAAPVSTIEEDSSTTKMLEGTLLGSWSRAILLEMVRAALQSFRINSRLIVVFRPAG